MLERVSGVEVLPITEILFGALASHANAIYGYHAKWTPDSAAYIDTSRRFGLEQDEPEQALELLLEAIGAAEGESRERLITLAVGLFAELGHEHPLTMRYRRQLAATLY